MALKARTSDSDSPTVRQSHASCTFLPAWRGVAWTGLFPVVFSFSATLLQYAVLYCTVPRQYPRQLSQLSASSASSAYTHSVFFDTWSLRRMAWSQIAEGADRTFYPTSVDLSSIITQTLHSAKLSRFIARIGPVKQFSALILTNKCGALCMCSDGRRNPHYTACTLPTPQRLKQMSDIYLSATLSGRCLALASRHSSWYINQTSAGSSELCAKLWTPCFE